MTCAEPRPTAVSRTTRNDRSRPAACVVVSGGAVGDRIEGWSMIGSLPLPFSATQDSDQPYEEDHHA